MLYIQLKKALNGTLQTVLLFWRLLSDTLVSWGLMINSYDQCMSNKIINGKQCTIVWHMDNLKISHVDKNIMEGIIKSFKKTFGEESPLTTTRCKVLEYIGLTLDYTRKVQVKISMYEHVRKLVENAPEDIIGTAKTQAFGHLFMTNPECDKLPEKTAQMFHHNVAKLLYLCRRTRQDIQTATAFLCIQVKSPDSDDYKKLACARSIRTYNHHISG